MADATFEGWAVVEIFGRQRYAGYVTTEAFGQAALFRVDVPPLMARERTTKHYEYVGGKSIPPGSIVQEDAVQGYTKYFGPGAIYSMTPCTQEAAERTVEAIQARSVTVISFAPEAPTLPPYDDSDDNEDGDNDESVDDYDDNDRPL